jgi:low affinity Fe/Cu permease
MAEKQSSRVFSRIAQWTAQQSARASTFIVACLIILVWGITGPLFGYSDTWQLIINTGTTIITFLMVFLLQNTQNRDTISIQIKLDELIRANENARNRLLSLDELSEEQLKHIKETFTRLAEAHDVLAEAGEKVDLVGEQVLEVHEKVLGAADEASAHAKAKAA